MDSRLCPTSFTQADPGDMFIVRNPGNVMPHSQLFGASHQSALSERAGLELAVSTGVEHIAVCGHSDCKVIVHFTVVSLMTWPWIVNEAGGDLVLIETSLLFICKSCCSHAN